MNDTMYKFKHYEDNPSLLTSIDKYEQDTQISLFDTAIPAQELKEM